MCDCLVVGRKVMLNFKSGEYIRKVFVFLQSVTQVTQKYKSEVLPN